MKSIAKLYFSRGKESMAKDVARRVRNEGNLCHLVYAALFEGPQHCMECHAVIIEKDALRADLIARSYRGAMPQVEIHWVDADGNFVSEADVAPADASAEQPAAPAAEPEQAADVRSAGPDSSDPGSPGE